MKIEVCDRCYYTNHTIKEATRTYRLKLGPKQVKGFLCLEHSNAAKAFVDSQPKDRQMDMFDAWLLNMEKLGKYGDHVVRV
jgi:hypothetical protein